MSSVEHRHQDRQHLVRPQQQHLLHGGQARLAQLLVGERVAEGEQPAGHVRHVLPTSKDRSQLGAPRLRPHRPHQLGEDGEQLLQLLGDVAGRRLVVHQVEDVEGVVDQAEPVVAHREQLVLRALDQDLQDGDQCRPGRPSVKDGKIELQGGGPELPDLANFLLARLRTLRHKELHQLHQLLDSAGVLGGVGRDVLERPLNVLVLGQSATECSGLSATEAEEAVVRRQHRSVEVHNVGVFVVGKDVVEGDVLDDGGAVEDQLDIVGAVEGGGVPEVEQGLLVLVHRDTGLAQLGMEKGPQVLDMVKVTSLFAKNQKKFHYLENRAKQHFLLPRQQQVCHNLID